MPTDRVPGVVPGGARVFSPAAAILETVFALFYFVFEGNFEYKPPGGAYIWRGDLTEGSLRYEFGGADIWRGLY